MSDFLGVSKRTAIRVQLRLYSDTDENKFDSGLSLNRC